MGYTTTMEPEQTTPADVPQEKGRLHQVTPVSKYLAMVLFIMLPFIGGWIGYELASGEVVEVERVVNTFETNEDYFSREELGHYSYMIGDAIYSTYSGEETLLFEDIDVETFALVPEFAEYQYVPVADGGYSPRWYQDQNYLYCIEGKGMPESVKIEQPIEVRFKELSGEFDLDDGMTQEEASAWQERPSGRYGHVYFYGVNSDLTYNTQCEHVSSDSLLDDEMERVGVQI